MKVKIITVIISALLIFSVFSCGSTQTATTAGNARQQPQIQPLKIIYQDYFPIGNIIKDNYMRGEYLDLLIEHFNYATAENSMKPSGLGPRERGGEYNWAPADRMVDLMLNNDIAIHGHTLVWHNQTHAWMTEGSPEVVRQNMISYINAVLAHYKGRVFSWDVVNEAVIDGINPGEQNWRNCLRPSGWYQAMGADYIDLAFRTARAADPDVLLFYNDYNLNNPRKATMVRDMVRDLNERYRAEGHDRNLIEVIGMQAHYSTSVSISNVRAALDMFREIGVSVAITELDVETRTVGGANSGTGRDSFATDTEQRIQALTYANLFQLFKEYSDLIIRVSFWGMDDELSWKSFGNPCLWDSNLEPKQAFFAVADPEGTLNR